MCTGLVLAGVAGGCGEVVDEAEDEVAREGAAEIADAGGVLVYVR